MAAILDRIPRRRSDARRSDVREVPNSGFRSQFGTELFVRDVDCKLIVTQSLRRNVHVWQHETRDSSHGNRRKSV